MRKVYARVLFSLPFLFFAPRAHGAAISLFPVSRLLAGLASPLNRANVYFYEGLQILPVILSKLFAAGMSRHRAQTNNPQNARARHRPKRRAENPPLDLIYLAGEIRFPGSSMYYPRENKLSGNKLMRLKIMRYHFDGKARERREDGNVSRVKFCSQTSRARDKEARLRRRPRQTGGAFPFDRPLMPCFIFD